MLTFPTLSSISFIISCLLLALVICLLAIKRLSMSSLFQPLHFLYLVVLVGSSYICFFTLSISGHFSLRYFKYLLYNLIFQYLILFHLIEVVEFIVIEFLESSLSDYHFFSLSALSPSGLLSDFGQ